MIFFKKLFGLSNSTSTKDPSLNLINENNTSIELDYIWCLVGNIKESHYHGVDKVSTKGTKYFNAGAKVYCFPSKWGDAYERIWVIGQNRKSKKPITIIINSDLITNWRLKKVHDPIIIKKMKEKNGWDNTNKSKKIILNMLGWLNK